MPAVFLSSVSVLHIFSQFVKRIPEPLGYRGGISPEMALRMQIAAVRALSHFPDLPADILAEGGKLFPSLFPDHLPDSGRDLFFKKLLCPLVQFFQLPAPLLTLHGDPFKIRGLARKPLPAALPGIAKVVLLRVFRRDFEPFLELPDLLPA